MFITITMAIKYIFLVFNSRKIETWQNFKTKTCNDVKNISFLLESLTLFIQQKFKMIKVKKINL